jgi:hypothetical protein
MLKRYMRQGAGEILSMPSAACVWQHRIGGNVDLPREVDL